MDSPLTSFTLLVPEDAQGIHLKALARLSRLLKNENYAAAYGGEDAQTLYSILIEEDQKL